MSVSNRIAFLVQSDLEEGLRTGRYPLEWLQDPDEVPEENKLDRVGADAVLACMRKLKEGQKLSRTEAALLQIILDVEAHELEDLCTSTNGDSKVKRSKQ